MRNWPLILTVIIAFAAFAHGMSSMITPEMYREMSPPRLGYVFVPDDDTFVDTNHFLEIRFIQFGPEAPESVTAWIIRHHGDIPEPLEFEPVFFEAEQTEKWIAILPPLSEKGQRWFYYLTIETTEGRSIEIWKDMNLFEKLFSGFTREHQHFWATYEGNVIKEARYGKVMLVSHIVLSFGALMFMFHVIFYVFGIFAGFDVTSFIKAYKSSFWAILTFTIGAIVLGIPITWFTFACGFMPWPTQGIASMGDVTDTKSTLLVIAWVIHLLSHYKTYRQALTGHVEKGQLIRFGIWTIVALLFTIFVFLIPHSQFMQSNT